MARLGKNHRAAIDVREHLLGLREPINYCCEGCKKIDEEELNLCTVYIYPEKAWRIGGCPTATHTKKEEMKKSKVRVGQQKQSKNK